MEESEKRRASIIFAVLSSKPRLSSTKASLQRHNSGSPPSLVKMTRSTCVSFTLFLFLLHLRLYDYNKCVKILFVCSQGRM